MKDPNLESSDAFELIVGGYYYKLIAKNERLQELFAKYAGKLTDPECWECLTPGQRLLTSLGALDGEVKNGGISQFFWNCSDLAFEVSDALQKLGETELLELYERALQGLIGKKDDWIELRKQAFKDPSNPNWEPFQKSYKLLDLGWFDDAYFDKYGPSVLRRLADYVKAHKEEFIDPNAAP
jgi:hypothetical protein